MAPNRILGTVFGSKGTPSGTADDGDPVMERIRTALRAPTDDLEEWFRDHGAGAVFGMAVRVASMAHEGQSYNGVPYTRHLATVVEVLKDAGGAGANILAAAVLHDVLEDTEVREEHLAEVFDPEIVATVAALTDPPGLGRSEAKALSLPRIGKTESARIVKIADRIANLDAALAPFVGARYSHTPAAEQESRGLRFLHTYLREHELFEEHLITPTAGNRGELEEMVVRILEGLIREAREVRTLAAQG